MNTKSSLLVLATLTIASAYRLPKNVMPESYRLEIFTPFGKKDSFDFTGKVWIETSCVSPTHNITLHSKQLDLDEKSITIKDITSKKKESVPNLTFTHDKPNDFFIIHFEQPLTEDHRYEIYIPFKGVLDDGLAGFYRSSYIDPKTNEKKWLGVTQFEAIAARRAFPCFDEPEFKATFDISLARGAEFNSISNMPLLTSEPIKEHPGWFWDRFDVSVPMSTYLVAYIVSDFHYKESEATGNNVTFRIWSREDALNQVQFASEVGPKALRFFEEFFNIDYPLPKQDMVAIPDFSAGAMENWGLITYREAYLLYDPKVSTASNKHGIASTIAHELAHQWFGNLVTMKWWTDLWLNEGFATYMASVAVEHLFPQWSSLDDTGASNMMEVFSFDSLRSSHPVSVPIGNPKEIDEIFDTISYKKGSSLIRMMSLFLGEETLRSGVSNYLRKHRYHNAEQDDLWASLTEVAHKKKVLPEGMTVKTIMDTWTLQTGYPVVNVERDYENGKIQLTQERFLRDTIKFRDDQRQCWWVPITYSTAHNLDFESSTPKHWLTCDGDERNQTIDKIADADEWVIFNNKMSGIYRVNYDLKNWHLISDALKTDHQKIPTLNRVQLIEDAADLAFIGSLDYDIFFKILQYLKNEMEFLPWQTALDNSDTLRNRLRTSSTYGYFQIYMRKILAPMYEKLGGLVVKDADSDKLDRVKFQVSVASRSCKYEVAKCIEDAKKLFREYQENPDKPNPIPKDLRKIVYCTALRNGDSHDWDFLWKKYETSNVATEKNSLLGVLGCTKEVWLLNRYLEWSLNDTKIRRQDAATVFSSVTANDVGFFVAKQFFLENVQKIFDYLSPNTRRISRYLTNLASMINTPRDLEELEELIDHNKEKFAELKQGVQQSLESIQIHIQWNQKHAAEIHKVLHKYSKNH